MGLRDRRDEGEANTFKRNNFVKLIHGDMIYICRGKEIMARMRKGDRYSYCEAYGDLEFSKATGNITEEEVIYWDGVLIKFLREEKQGLPKRFF